MDKKMKVGVIFGGMSSENEVSLASGRYICMNVSPMKYNCVPVYLDVNGNFWKVPQKLVVKNTTSDIETRLEKDAERIPYEKLKDEIDFAFIALHGKYGDDGCIQGLLELLKIPYTGSGVLASALGMDKEVQALLLKQGGCLVANMIPVYKREWDEAEVKVMENIESEIGFPMVIKPAREGSSVGVSVVKSKTQIKSAFERAFKHDIRALCEEYLDGLEFSCIILGNDYDHLTVMPPTETCYESEYFTYEDKYMPGKSQKITPARVSDDTLERIKEESAKAYRILGFKIYGRIDGFVVGDKVLITDPNSSSGMAPSSFIFHQAAEVGLTAQMLVDKLIQLGTEAHEEKIGPL